MLALSPFAILAITATTALASILHSKSNLIASGTVPRCLVGDGQFGFEEGGLYSLKQFQEKAADFKQSYLRIACHSILS